MAKHDNGWDVKEGAYADAPDGEGYAKAFGERIDITFHTGTDAFRDNPAGGIEWVLHDLARQFVSYGWPEDGCIYDSYGNQIGKVTITRDGE